MATRSSEDVLYHYTTQTGLLGIIGHGSAAIDKKTPRASIRATSIRHLNDSLEYHYAFGLAREMLRDEGDGPTQENLDAAQALLNSHVVSFSEEDDELSLWRAYCKDAAGFAIGFDAKRLQKLAEHQAYSLCKCTYNRLTNHSTVFAAVTKHRDETDNELRKDKNFALVKKFLRIASTAKHPSFHHEKEWRLVTQVFLRDSATGKISYREGKSFLVPYRVFDLGELGKESPIVSIRVGPTPHKELALQTVKDYMAHMGMPHVDVQSSDTPYRSW